MQTNSFYTDPTDGHVSLDRLRRYQAGALPAAEQHQVEKHLLDCDLCADLLEGLEASPAPITQRAVQDINRRLASSLAQKRKAATVYAQPKTWSVAAAVVLFILASAVVFYYNLTEIKQTEKTAAIKASAAAASSTTKTIVKPAPPAVAENTKPRIQADSTTERRALAIHTSPVVTPALKNKPDLPGTASPEPEKVTDVTATAKLENKEITADVSPVFTPADTPALAIAPQPGIMPDQLSGKAAGVVSNSALKKSRASAGALREKNVIAGRLIKGKVTDESGEALPGVTVVVKGTPVGTVTNPQGEYTLSLPEGKPEATLVFNFIGFTTTEKQIESPAPVALNIKMEADTKSLSEVVVVGYGTHQNTATVTKAKPTVGFKAFRNYIQANLKYPPEAKEQKIAGRVVVGFTVNPDGALSDFKIIKSLSPACNAEAIRVIQEGPRWEPTKKNNTAVTESVRLAIRFKPSK